MTNINTLVGFDTEHFSTSPVRSAFGPLERSQHNITDYNQANWMSAKMLSFELPLLNLIKLEIQEDDVIYFSSTTAFSRKLQHEIDKTVDNVEVRVDVVNRVMTAIRKEMTLQLLTLRYSSKSTLPNELKRIVWSYVVDLYVIHFAEVLTQMAFANWSVDILKGLELYRGVAKEVESKEIRLFHRKVSKRNKMHLISRGNELQVEWD